MLVKLTKNTTFSELADKQSWDIIWRSFYIFKPLRRFIFEDLLRRYLSYSKEKTMIEFGCFPGDNLVHLHRLFGYKVSGIDYSKYTNQVEERLRFLELMMQK